MTDHAASSGSPEHRFSRKQIIQVLITIVVVGLIFVGVLPKIADYSLVWKTVRDLTGLESAALIVAGAWNLFSYLPVLVASLPGLRLREAFVSTEATTAVANTVPAGGAVAVGLTFAMYGSWGFSPAEIVRSIGVTGIWNSFTKLGMPIIALALLATQGDLPSGLVTAAVIGVIVLIVAIVLFALLLKSERLARSIGDGLERAVHAVLAVFKKDWKADWGEAAARFRSDTIGLLRTRWIWLTLATLVSHLSLFLVLLLCLREVGVSEEEVSTLKTFAAFAFIRLLSALPITPGGVGVVELGYVGALAAGVPDSLDAQIVAATLLFRAITYFLPIPLGVCTWLFWRRNTSWRKEQRSEPVPQPAAGAPAVS